jgi:hypothetical protein
MPNSAVDIFEWFEWFVGINDSTPNGSLLKSETFTVMKDDRGSGPVDIKYQTAAGRHQWAPWCALLRLGR